MKDIIKLAILYMQLRDDLNGEERSVILKTIKEAVFPKIIFNASGSDGGLGGGGNGNKTTT